MSAPYIPGKLSREYHRLARVIREDVDREVDRLFQEQTGVTRKLNPTGSADLELRRTWLRLRDQVMGKLDELLDEKIEQDKRDGVLQEIPYEMRWHKWEQGARLLETWFERPIAIAPKYSAPVTDVIRMDWVLTFPRAKEVYDKIFADRIWTNDASAKRMAAILPVPTGSGTFLIGDLSKPVTVVDEKWINARPVKNGWEEDGMAAALANFNFHVAIAGKTQRLNALEYAVTVEEVGVYVKDSFDFEGDQFLGWWGYNDSLIYNADFREWRNRNNAGGDFLVYSDVKRTRLPKSEAVTVKVP